MSRFLGCAFLIYLPVLFSGGVSLGSVEGTCAPNPGKLSQALAMPYLAERTPAPLVLEDFLSKLQNPSFQSLDDLPSFLKENGFHGLWTPVYESHAQEVRDHPFFKGMIRFLQLSEDQDARTTLAYYGCKKRNEDGEMVALEDASHAYPECEKMQIAHSYPDGRVELREVSFPGRAALPGSVPQVSKPNPETCLVCHGSPPRLRWEASYNGWPHIFGSIGREHLEYIKRDSWEWNRYQSLPQEMASEARFAHLVWREGDALKNSFYQDPEYPNMDKAVEGASKNGLDVVKHSDTTDPNTVITSAYYDINAMRIAYLVRQAHEYDTLKYPIIAFLKGCRNYSDFASLSLDEKLIEQKGREFENKEHDEFEKLRAEILEKNSISPQTRSSSKSLSLLYPISFNYGNFEDPIDAGTAQYQTAIEGYRFASPIFQDLAAISAVMKDHKELGTIEFWNTSDKRPYNYMTDTTSYPRNVLDEFAGAVLSCEPDLQKKLRESKNECDALAQAFKAQVESRP